MRTLGWIAVFLFAVLPCRSQQTLREQLRSAGIPQDSFSETQLNRPVDGSGAKDNQFIYFVFILRTNDGMLTGFPQVVRYDTSKGALLRAEVKPEDHDLCCGSPEGIDLIDDYLLLYFHFNPSAASVLVLDSELKLVDTLYGFGMERVAPNEVVFTENMVHFAAVHQERQQWVNFSTGASLEVYPLRNDALRNQFDSDHEKKAPEVCKQSEDLCNGGEFDEGCTFLGGDGKGKFALDCGRSASYQPKEGQGPAVYASDDAIYIYARNAKGWEYCEQAITEDEAKQLDNAKEHPYESVKNRCVPSLPVVPDSSTSDLSPFPAPSHRK
jgi:hypothetical protein